MECNDVAIRWKFNNSLTEKPRALIKIASLCCLIGVLFYSRKGKMMMIAEQLTLLEAVNEKEVRKLVIKELKNYRAAKVQLENKKECNEAGVALFPSLRNSTNINELKVKQIERAFTNSLDDDERLIIEKKYLSAGRIKDINVYTELGINKDPYYDLKWSAINNIATALGII